MTTATERAGLATGTAAAPDDVGRTAARLGLPAWSGLLIRPLVVAVAVLAVWLWVSAAPLDELEARTLTLGTIGTQLRQHIWLSVVCTLVTIVIAIPLGVAITLSRNRVGRALVLGLGNLGQAIPSIGLLALATIVLGIGFHTAVIGLVVYAALPVLRNTLVGLEGVDPVLTEAGRGVGMSRRSVLWTVELPLAVPVIVAGIRTALVLTVASAPLAALVNGGGLGEGLFTGLNLDRPRISIVFGVLVAALALLFDWLGLLAERFLRPRGI